METPTRTRPSTIVLPRRTILRGAAFTTGGPHRGHGGVGLRRHPTGLDHAGPRHRGAGRHWRAASTSPRMPRPWPPGRPAGQRELPRRTMMRRPQAVVKRFLGGEWQQVPGYGNQPIAADHGRRHQGLRHDHRPHRAHAQCDAQAQSMPWASTAPGRDPSSGSPRATRSAPSSPTTSTSPRASTSTARSSPMPWTACRSSPSRPSSPVSSSRYEFTAKPAGSHMYHSHHNATDQVGRGLLGAFLVDPAIRRSATTRSTARPRTSSGSATTRSAASPSTADSSRPPRPSSRSWASRSSSAS